MNIYKKIKTLMVFAFFMAVSSITNAAVLTTYYHNDQLGSPIAATDEYGYKLWTENYQAYGERTVKNVNADKNRFWFTGKPLDSNTGLNYFGARYYDPMIGRFMGVDPVGARAGDVHNFNRYAYANNNPYKFVDPDGKEAADILRGIWNSSLDTPAYMGINGIAQLLGKDLRLDYVDNLDGYAAEYAPLLLSGGRLALGKISSKIMSKFVAKSADKLKYHYTTADEVFFKNGLWKDSSVTDKLYKNAKEAGQKLGIPTPNKVIPIKDNGNFVPNKPAIVGPSNRYQGGGTDFINPQRVPSKDIFPAKPIGGS